MINFRFHLLSLVAVFLSLGLGILMGSTVIDQEIVDRLDREIASVSKESDARKAENADLKRRLDRADEYVADASLFTLQDRLVGVPVALLAERGVDGDVVEDMLGMLREAGAEVPGVLWLDESWLLDDEKSLQAMKDAIGASGDVDAVRVQGFDALATRLAQLEADTTSTTLANGVTDSTETALPSTSPGPSQSNVLDGLRAARFVDLTDGKEADLVTFPSGAARALVVTGTDSRLAATGVTLQLVRALAGSGVPTVVSEVYDDHDGATGTPERAASIADIRGDDALTKSVSTVDDLELVQGRVTAVLALETIANGAVGHYGYGRGAASAAPSRQP